MVLATSWPLYFAQAAAWGSRLLNIQARQYQGCRPLAHPFCLTTQSASKWCDVALYERAGTGGYTALAVGTLAAGKSPAPARASLESCTVEVASTLGAHGYDPLYQVATTKDRLGFWGRYTGSILSAL